MSASEWRLFGLQIATGLAVTFVRHDLEKHRVAWDSLGDFLITWFIHTIALLVLIAITTVPILRFHKFFVGHELSTSKGDVETVGFYVLMTVLVASVCIFFVAHYVPIDDYD